MLDFAQNRWDSAALEVKNLHINVIDELWCQRPEPRDPKSLHVHWLPFGSGANTCQYHPPETNVYCSCDMLLHATESRKLIHFEHVGTFFWLKLRSSSLVLCRAPTKQDQGSRAQFQECLKFQEDSISRSVCKVTRHEMLGHVWHVISDMLIYTFIYIACEAQIRRKFHRFQSPITPLCESTLAFQVAMLYQRLISNLLCLFKKMAALAFQVPYSTCFWAQPCFRARPKGRNGTCNKESRCTSSLWNSHTVALTQTMFSRFLKSSARDNQLPRIICPCRQPHKHSWSLCILLLRSRQSA